jgi:predicted AAA+ superfamily ATPase
VDFVARKASDIHYFQVSASILDQNTRLRELKPLQEISDNYAKTILTLDQTPYHDYAGIKVVQLIDFLRE